MQVDQWKNIPPPLTTSTHIHNESLYAIKMVCEKLIYKSKKNFRTLAEVNHAVCDNCNKNSNKMY